MNIYSERLKKILQSNAIQPEIWCTNDYQCNRARHDVKPTKLEKLFKTIYEANHMITDKYINHCLLQFETQSHCHHLRYLTKADILGRQIIGAERRRKAGLGWFGHVKRRDQDYVQRKTLEMVQTGRRKRESPKQRWMDCVNRDMRAIRTTKDEVHDRTGWGELCLLQRPHNQVGVARRRRLLP